jgi:hypothetical protein
VDGQFVLVLNRSLFSRDYILINVLKSLVLIGSMYNLRIISH